jgi:uncharacterized protein
MASDSLADVVETLRKQLPVLARRYSVESLGVFGSYVRHEHQPDSDLDLLVTFFETPGLIKFIELEQYLSDTLGIEVDLVMAGGLKPRVQERIQSEVLTV